MASYFCTPDGLVLHLVPGPASGRVLLSEARWPNETYEHARLENQTTPLELRAFFRRAHLARLHNEHRLLLPTEQLPELGIANRDAVNMLFDQNWRLNNAGKVHVLLAVMPLPPIEQVYQPVFERLLGEQISTNPVAAR